MRLLLVSLVAGFLLTLPSAAAQAGTCTPPAYPAANGQFSSDYKAKGLSCDKAAKVLLKHFACRTEKAPTGYCVHKVAGGFGCREERQSLSDKFVAAVTCVSGGGKKVSFGYQQYF